jgi:pimeloyl-ACP methyl ester carboxylesterase
MMSPKIPTQGIHMRTLRILTWLLLTMLYLPARADVVVLVHGYLGSDNSWVESGIMEILSTRDRNLAGVYYHSPQGMQYHAVGAPPRQPVYTLNLPSIAPIALQADWLRLYLQDIQQRHPNDPITLVGHSAGGVVARLLIVRDRPTNVSHLITIASPHQGTGRAYQALDAVSHGGLFAPFHRWAVRRSTGRAIYNTLRASRGVLFDLTPPRPGNLLYWLNKQPHPDIRYTSIIRNGTIQIPGDHVVPPVSQDMRLVHALRGKAASYSMAQGHLLSPQDGHVLANLLDQVATGPRDASH